MIYVRDIYQKLNQEYPFSSQEDWDNAGLLCGSFEQEVTVCVTALDVTPETVAFAAVSGAQLIISHHPVIFSGMKAVLHFSPVFQAIQHSISILSAHTNFDKAETGTGAVLSELLGWKTHMLENELFRMGELPQEKTVAELADELHIMLHTPVAYVLGEKPVKKIAVCTGAGGSEIARAATAGADCYITGEMKYHEFLDAKAMGLGVAAAGHFETEDIAMQVLNQRMQQWFPQVRWVKYTPEPPIQWSR